jgi:threonine/homoserine/homoserine lactone efflux protein
MRFALTIGIVFLIGGIMNVMMLPSPLWFTILDLVGAYLPMAYLAWKLGKKKG